MKMKFIILPLVIMLITAACKKEPGVREPAADKIEIGADNNKRAFIGMDFHFNAEVLAGDKIELAEIRIEQKSGQTYASPWKFRLSWPEFTGLKNATVHKHFDIPNEAPAGLYDFLFIVTDQNGTKLEVRSDLTIIDISTLPVSPVITVNSGPANNQVFKKDDVLQLNLTVKGIKGDGIAYVLMIKNRLGHNPETIRGIDFTKAVVIGEADHFSFQPNSQFNLTASLVIGASKDNRINAPNDISGDKSWETGGYSIVILYRNSTHSVDAIQKIPININY